MSIVVRIFCPTGIIRVTLPTDSMLSDLMSEIAERTGVPIEKQCLSIAPSDTSVSII